MLSTLVSSDQQTEIRNEQRKGFIQKISVVSFNRNPFEGNNALKVSFLTVLFSRVTGGKQGWCSELVDCEKNNHNHEAEFRNVAQNKAEFNHNLDQSFQNTPKTNLQLKGRTDDNNP